MKRRCLCILATILLLLTALRNHRPAQSQGMDLGAQAFAVLQSRCYDCHTSGGKNPLSVSALASFNMADPIQLKDKAGTANASRILFRINNKTSPMPPAHLPPGPTNTQPGPLSAAEIAILTTWVQAGAPAPTTPPNTGGAPAPRPFLANDAVLQLIDNDLATLDDAHALRARYFLLTNLWNNPNVRDADIATYRKAFAKLINSLSWASTIYLPTEVAGSNGTILRIDLARYNWTAATWNDVVNGYPYAVTYASGSTGALFGTAAHRAGTAVPAVRADWFCQHASRGDLYNALLDLPDTESKLETTSDGTRRPSLNVNRDNDCTLFPGDQCARAGLIPSGVTNHNRIVERHSSAFGYLWISLDFATADPGLGTDIEADPVKPSPDAEELIFSLPNHLQGYCIVDSHSGRLINDALESVVTAGPDKYHGVLSNPNDATIHNAVSCMSCHSVGMNSFRDAIRPYLLNAPPLKDTIIQQALALYPGQAVMQAFLDGDSKQFSGSMIQATGDAPASDQEPIALAVIAYEAPNAGVDLATAAAELGLPGADDLRIRLAKLQPLPDALAGVAALPAGGVMERGAWEAIFCQLVAALGLGNCIQLVTQGPQAVVEGQTLTFQLSAAGAPGGPVTFAAPDVATQAPGATFDAATGTFTWSPHFHQAGDYAVTFTASDGLVTDTGTVAIHVVRAVRPPVADAQSLVVLQDTPVPIMLTAASPDGYPLTFAIAAPPAHGMPSALTGMPAQTTIYTPAPGYTGPDSFTFIATDNQVPPQSSIETTVSILVTPRVLPPGTILSVAGNGMAGFGGDGGPATQARLSGPGGVAVDAAGNIYIADTLNNRVRMLSPRLSAGGTMAYTITTVAGSGILAPDGTGGFSGDGGPAVKAQFNQPQGVAVDSRGNLYVADMGNSRVRKVDAHGIITTVAGDGRFDFGGDGGPATSAEFYNPAAVAVDPAGDLYVSDRENNRVREITTEGIINTIAGTGAGDFFGDGGPATRAALNTPAGLSLGADGSVFVVDNGNERVRRIAPDGTISTVAGSATDKDPNLGANALKAGFAGDGGPATQALLAQPVDVAVDPAGSLFILSIGDGRVRQVTPDGTIRTVVGNGPPGGDGGPAALAGLMCPRGIALDPSGSLLIADTTDERIREVNGIAAARSAPARGTIVTVAGSGAAGFAGDAGWGLRAALHNPMAVALDAGGSLLIADARNNRVRRLSPAGVLTTLAGGGTGTGDGTPATAVILSRPQALAADRAGGLFEAEGNRVRKIAPDGTIDAVAGTGAGGFFGDSGPAALAQLDFPAGLALDPTGDLFIADSFNNRVRRVDRGGQITTFAGSGPTGVANPVFVGDGGPASAARMSSPSSLAMDSKGALYIWDGYNQRVRRVGPDGVITTVAGGGSSPDSLGDNGPAIGAYLGTLGAIAVDSAGSLFLADTYAHRVRKVDTQGTITTVAGTGVQGFFGDGGPATQAALHSPAALAIDRLGNLYVADSGNNRIREVTGIAAPGLLAGRPFASRGDLNDDGKVNAQDALLLLRAVVGLAPLSDTQQALADLNGDGVVDVQDLILLLRKAVGLR